MSKVLYRIKVPDNAATNDFNLSAGTSLVPKFNKKISFNTKKKDGITDHSVTFEMRNITKGKGVAYPNGDSIQWLGKEYKLETMTIFKGLYNDYSGSAGVNNNNKDKAEVMLMFKNGNDTVYVFFLLSKSSQIKSGFFELFINSRNGKAGPPSEESSYNDREVSILDLMPNNSKHVHVFNNITRLMNHEYDNTGLDGEDNSSSTVIIFSPSSGGYKNIPIDAGTIGCFFGFKDSEKKENCNELLEKIKDASMNTIQLELGTNITCQGGNTTFCNIGTQMKWKGDDPQSDDGSKKNVYLLTSTNRYSRLDNPFELAHSIGGIGSVLTSCYEVEVDMSGNEISQGEKHIPAYKDKYMIPQEYWFKPGSSMSAAEMKEKEDATKKFWFQAGEPGFIILMVAAGLAAFVLLFILFKEIQLKYLPPRIKAATGVDVGGPK